MSAMLSDAEFLAAFEEGTLDPATFHHADHVRVAMLMLERRPLSEAASAFAAALKRVALSAGKPDLYHETRTIAFLALISDRLTRDSTADWPAFRKANADLFDKNCLVRHYTRDELDAPMARQRFVLPNARSRRKTRWLGRLRASFALLLAVASIAALVAGPAGKPATAELETAMAACELLGAVLFLNARTRIAGAALLLLSFAGAEITHLLLGDFRFAYPLYALATLGFLAAEPLNRSDRPTSS